MSDEEARLAALRAAAKSPPVAALPPPTLPADARPSPPTPMVSCACSWAKQLGEVDHAAFRRVGLATNVLMRDRPIFEHKKTGLRACVPPAKSCCVDYFGVHVSDVPELYPARRDVLDGEGQG